MALLLTAGAVAPTMASLSFTSSSSSSAARLSFSRTQSLAGAGVLCLSSPSPALSLSAATASPLPSVYCGRGDKKTAKGKRFKHSFGNARPRNKKKGRGPPRVPAPPLPPRKDKYDDGEVVKIDIDESFFS